MSTKFLFYYTAPTGPPLNFTIDVTGTTLDLSWEQPSLEQRGGLIRYYTLTCTPDGEGEGTENLPFEQCDCLLPG